MKMKITGCYFYLQGLFRGARLYGIINEMIMNKDYEKLVDDVEISKLRSTTKNPCDTNIREYDLLFDEDILTNIGCKAYFMMGKGLPNIRIVQLWSK